MDRKALRNDLILILSLLLVAAVSLIVLLSRTQKNNLVAKISVQNEVIKVVDLSNNEELDFDIDGLKGKLHIHTKEGAIAITESNCPHQDCVHMGYVSESGRPIICAYNAVTIEIEGASSNDDVILG